MSGLITNSRTRGAARVAGATLLTICAGQVLAAEPPSREEMWRMIQEQQKTIDELKARLEGTDEKVKQVELKTEETDKKVEATADAVEEAGRTGTAGTSWADRTSVGGYGELHYNNLDNDGTGDDLDEVDFHRFVLFFGHEFTDDLRFFSELELEHSLAGEGKDGEIELEMAWLEMDLTDHHRLRGGLDILPIGIINQTHEPNTFYGVERNKIESQIIPTTWWEAGVGLNGEVAPGWNYDLVLHSGLDVDTDMSGDSAFAPRSGRQKVSEALANDGAVTGRLRYTAIPGLEVGVSGQYQDDITQGDLGISATLFEGHVDYKHRSGFGLRALYARWDMDDGPAGIGPAAVGADTVDGFYVEPAYRFALNGPVPGELGFFARYSQYDAGNGMDGIDYQFAEYDKYTAGLNWWPHPSTVVKFDYTSEDADGPVENEFEGFNLGLGYQF